MNFVNIENIKGGYLPRNSNKDKMRILADWFVHDVGTGIRSWLDWFEDRNKLAEDTESNATWLSKEWLPNGECDITFGSIVDLIQDNSPVHISDPAHVVIMPRENVIELLNTWKELLKIRPDKIMITEENGIYKMFAVQ